MWLLFPSWLRDLLSFLSHWFCNLSKKLHEILSLEQPVPICRIPVHRDFPVSCPSPDGSGRNPENLGCFRNFDVFAEFRHNPPPNLMAYDVGRSLSNFTANQQHRSCHKSRTLVELLFAFHRVVGNSAAAIFSGSSRTVTPLVTGREKICWLYELSGEVFFGHGVVFTAISTDINPNSWLVVQPQSMLFSTRQILKCAI